MYLTKKICALVRQRSRNSTPVCDSRTAACCRHGRDAAISSLQTVCIPSWHARSKAAACQSSNIAMEKRRLGQSDLQLAPLMLGGNVFGWMIDEKTSFDIL